MKPLCERDMQGILMNWLLREKNHAYVLPGANSFFSWEADVISVTRSMLAHEFEIKISQSDYRRDADKWKHKHLGSFRGPAYFWYATTFEVEPPEHAGLVMVSYNEKRHYYEVSVRKEAPRLHQAKVRDDQIVQIAHLLSFRVMSEYVAGAYKVEAV